MSALAVDPGASAPDLVALARAVAAVSEVDRLPEGPSGRAQRLAAIRTAIDALKVTFTATVAASDSAGDGQLHGATTTAAWLRHELRLAPGDASERVRLARAVHSGARPLAAAAAAVAGGTVTYDQLTAISAATRHLSDEQSAEAAALLTDLAPAVDTRQLRSAARYLAHVVDPDRGAARFERQFDDRRATFAPLLDGSWRMEVHAEPEGAAVLDAALTRWMVPTDAGDLRTASQRRYDALVRIARTALDASTTGLVGSSGPDLLVTCTPESLARAWRAGAVDSAAPAALRDGTPLPPPALARIACDAAITRVVFDPAGRVLDLGRTQRLFSPGQRLALWARDRGCRFPGCGAPWGHAHHTHPWSQGGRTDLADGVVLCGRHHRAVHEEAWRIEVGGGALGSHGPVTFVGPRGQRLTSRPPGPPWPLAPRALAPP